MFIFSLRKIPEYKRRSKLHFICYVLIFENKTLQRFQDSKKVFQHLKIYNS